MVDHQNDQRTSGAVAACEAADLGRAERLIAVRAIFREVGPAAVEAELGVLLVRSHVGAAHHAVGLGVRAVATVVAHKSGGGLVLGAVRAAAGLLGRLGMHHQMNDHRLRRGRRLHGHRRGSLMHDGCWHC